MNPNPIPAHLGGERVAAEAVDLDGATVDQTGPAVAADDVDADFTENAPDTGGSPIGGADAAR